VWHSALLKDTLRGMEWSTSAAVACFFCTILNKFGYWIFKGWEPNHLSSQNLIWVPLSSLNFPRLKKMSSTPNKPFQKWENPFFFSNWLRVLFFRYLFLINSCQVLYSLQSLKSHLLKRHLFCKSRFWISKPPCSFGWHKIFHFAGLYFFLCSSFCQKKPWSKIFNLF
jgi:hypothetical protein